MGAGALFGGPLGAQIGGSAGGLIGGMFGGGESEAERALKRAQQAIAAIPVPTAKDMQLVLAPLVQQGILTPEAYQTILQKPSEFLNIDIGQEARNAEIAALSQLQDVASEGGRDSQFRAAMNDAMNQANTQLQGQKESILQDASQRGVANSNLTQAAQLAAAFGANANASNASVNAAAEAEKRALQAISDSATLGGQIRSQDWQQAAQKAQALDAINAYNAQNSQNQANLNTQGRNLAQAQNLDLAQQVAQANTNIKNQQAQYNAALPQQQFQNQLAKASALAGIAQPQANLYQQQAANQATTQGNLIGGLGQGLASYYGAKNAAKTPNTTTQTAGSWNGMLAHGGPVPGEAPYPGDDPRNDVVDAKLSPGEVVVPRTAAQNPIKLADFVAHLPKNGPSKVHPEDVRAVLEALTSRRENFWKGGMC